MSIIYTIVIIRPGNQSKNSNWLPSLSQADQNQYIIQMYIIWLRQLVRKKVKFSSTQLGVNFVRVAILSVTAEHFFQEFFSSVETAFEDGDAIRCRTKSQVSCLIFPFADKCWGCRHGSCRHNHWCEYSDQTSLHRQRIMQIPLYNTIILMGRSWRYCNTRPTRGKGGASS